MSESEAVKCWIYCNLCNGNTRHLLVSSKEYNHGYGAEDEGHYEWGVYRFWACAGCDTCTMEDHYTATYMFSDPNNTGIVQQVYESIYHPKRTSSSHKRKYYSNLPEKLATLYSEVVNSNNEGYHLLCAAGLRALLEGICVDKKIPGADLEKKIDGMKALVPENIVRNLHTFRFMGNDAVHRLEAPKSFELSVALDVIEDILNFLYALDYNANMLGTLSAVRRQSSKPIAAAPVQTAVPAQAASTKPEANGPAQTSLDNPSK